MSTTSAASAKAMGNRIVSPLQRFVPYCQHLLNQNAVPDFFVKLGLYLEILQLFPLVLNSHMPFSDTGNRLWLAVVGGLHGNFLWDPTVYWSGVGGDGVGEQILDGGRTNEGRDLGAIEAEFTAAGGHILTYPSFLVIFWIAFVLVMLPLVAVGLTLAKPTLRHSFIEACTSLHLCLWGPLFFPLGHILVTTFTCTKGTTGHLWLFPGEGPCLGTALTTAHWILGLIAFIVFSFTALLPAYCAYNRDPLSTGASPLAHSYHQRFFWLYKTGLLLAFHLMLSHGLHAYYLMIVAMTSCCLALYIGFTLPFVTFIDNQYHVAALGTLCWFATAGFIHLTEGEQRSFIDDGSLYSTMFLGGAVVGVVSWFATTIRLSPTTRYLMKQATRPEWVPKHRNPFAIAAATADADLLPYPTNLPLSDNIFSPIRGIDAEILSDHLARYASLSEKEFQEVLDSYISTVQVVSPTIDKIYVSTDVEVSCRFLYTWTKETACEPTPHMLSFAARIFSKGMLKYKDSPLLTEAYVDFVSINAPSVNRLRSCRAMIDKAIAGYNCDLADYVVLNDLNRDIKNDLGIQDKTSRVNVRALNLHFRSSLVQTALLWRAIYQAGDITEISNQAARYSAVREKALEAFVSSIRDETLDEIQVRKFGDFIRNIYRNEEAYEACQSTADEIAEERRWRLKRNTGSMDSSSSSGGGKGKSGHKGTGTSKSNGSQVSRGSSQASTRMSKSAIRKAQTARQRTLVFQINNALEAQNYEAVEASSAAHHVLLAIALVLILGVIGANFGVTFAASDNNSPVNQQLVPISNARYLVPLLSTETYRLVNISNHIISAKNNISNGVASSISTLAVLEEEASYVTGKMEALRHELVSTINTITVGDGKPSTSTGKLFLEQRVFRARIFRTPENGIDHEDVTQNFVELNSLFTSSLGEVLQLARKSIEALIGSHYVETITFNAPRVMSDALSAAADSVLQVDEENTVSISGVTIAILVFSLIILVLMSIGMFYQGNALSAKRLQTIQLVHNVPRDVSKRLASESLRRLEKFVDSESSLGSKLIYGEDLGTVEGTSEGAATTDPNSTSLDLSASASGSKHAGGSIAAEVPSSTQITSHQLLHSILRRDSTIQAKQLDPSQKRKSGTGGAAGDSDEVESPGDRDSSPRSPTTTKSDKNGKTKKNGGALLTEAQLAKLVAADGPEDNARKTSIALSSSAAGSSMGSLLDFVQNQNERATATQEKTTSRLLNSRAGGNRATITKGGRGESKQKGNRKKSRGGRNDLDGDHPDDSSFHSSDTESRGSIGSDDEDSPDGGRGSGGLGGKKHRHQGKLSNAQLSTLTFSLICAVAVLILLAIRTSGDFDEPSQEIASFRDLVQFEQKIGLHSKAFASTLRQEYYTQAQQSVQLSEAIDSHLENVHHSAIDAFVLASYHRSELHYRSRVVLQLIAHAINLGPADAPEAQHPHWDESSTTVAEVKYTINSSTVLLAQSSGEQIEAGRYILFNAAHDELQSKFLEEMDLAITQRLEYARVYNTGLVDKRRSISIAAAVMSGLSILTLFAFMAQGSKHHRRAEFIALALIHAACLLTVSILTFVTSNNENLVVSDAILRDQVQQFLVRDGLYVSNVDSKARGYAFFGETVLVIGYEELSHSEQAADHERQLAFFTRETPPQTPMIVEVIDRNTKLAEEVHYLQRIGVAMASKAFNYDSSLPFLHQAWSLEDEPDFAVNRLKYPELIEGHRDHTGHLEAHYNLSSIDLAETNLTVLKEKTLGAVGSRRYADKISERLDSIQELAKEIDVELLAAFHSENPATNTLQVILASAAVTTLVILCTMLAIFTIVRMQTEEQQIILQHMFPSKSTRFIALGFLIVSALLVGLTALNLQVTRDLSEEMTVLRHSGSRAGHLAKGISLLEGMVHAHSFEEKLALQTILKEVVEAAEDANFDVIVGKSVYASLRKTQNQAFFGLESGTASVDLRTLSLGSDNCYETFQGPTGSQQTGILQFYSVLRDLKTIADYQASSLVDQEFGSAITPRYSPRVTLEGSTSDAIRKIDQVLETLRASTTSYASSITSSGEERRILGCCLAAVALLVVIGVFAFFLLPVVDYARNQEIDSRLLFIGMPDDVRANPEISDYIVGQEESAEKQLAKNLQQSEKLLQNILPPAISRRLKGGETTIADQHDEVTVAFAALSNFDEYSGSMAPHQLVLFLNNLIVTYDAIVDLLELEKIKTIADTYFLCGGLSKQSEKDHALRCADCAMFFMEALTDHNSRHSTPNLRMRIGIHTGPAVAGVIGTTKVAYDLWGDTVNTASRMYSTSKPGRIQCSKWAYESSGVKDYFSWDDNQVVAKGKGTLHTYLVKERVKETPWSAEGWRRKVNA